MESEPRIGSSTFTSPDGFTLSTLSASAAPARVTMAPPKSAAVKAFRTMFLPFLFGQVVCGDFASQRLRLHRAPVQVGVSSQCDAGGRLATQFGVREGDIHRRGPAK